MKELKKLPFLFDMDCLGKVDYPDDIKVWRAFASISEEIMPKDLFYFLD